MKAQIEFNVELARIYDETRPIDREACGACFRDALEGRLLHRNFTIMDVGCGTGRILECLIPELFRKDQVVGIDISSEMLEIARNKSALKGLTFRNISIMDFASEVRNQGQFDVVICNWLFHCVLDWRNVLRACISIAKPSATLVWLEEDGDLYRALDMIGASQPTPTTDALQRLFDAYHGCVEKLLAAHDLPGVKPVSRIGPPLRCTGDLADALATCNWTTQREFAVHYWKRRVSVNWIVKKVLSLRAFTNLQRVPVPINEAAIADLECQLGRAGMPNANDTLELNFWAKPTIAFRANSDCTSAPYRGSINTLGRRIRR